MLLCAPFGRDVVVQECAGKRKLQSKLIFFNTTKQFQQQRKHLTVVRMSTKWKTKRSLLISCAFPILCVNSAFQFNEVTKSRVLGRTSAFKQLTSQALSASNTSNHDSASRKRIQISTKDYVKHVVKSLKNVRGGGQLHQQGKLARDAKQRRKRMYAMCLGIVFIWITSGTLFYSKINDWPLPQSFFYAVDAGMSIGFCTDVFEVKRTSKLFTVLYILLGASCVGGALALFIKDILEGVVDLRHEAYESLLAENLVQRFDVLGTGKISYSKFRIMVEEWVGRKIDDEGFTKICRRFDPLDTGQIKTRHFVEKCHKIEALLSTNGPLYSKNKAVRILAQAWETVNRSNQRIYYILLTWILAGMLWGVKRQGWDIITSAHFAVSALATGGLTGVSADIFENEPYQSVSKINLNLIYSQPSVNSKGILPTEPAIFCGLYCLFGIPLFALTLGHFARLLVECKSYVLCSYAIILSISFDILDGILLF